MIYLLPFDINRLTEEKQTEIDELIDDYKKEPGSSQINFALSNLEFKGMTFVGDRYCPEVPFTDPLAIESLQNLRNTGCDYIALVVTEYQDYADSTEIYPIYENYIKTPYYIHKTETIEGITKVVNEAHRLGIRVIMKPHIDLSRELRYNAIWRGNIGGFHSESDWQKWFASYEKMILKYAKLSEELKVEMLCISTELIAVSHRTEDWKKIIKNVRNVYHGLLTDAANHSGEETSKRWWDAVDYIGVDAYYMGGSLFSNKSKTVKDEKIEELTQKQLSNFLMFSTFSIFEIVSKIFV